MDSAFQSHDIGYSRGELDQSDFQLLYDLDRLPANPTEWGEEVNTIYATVYRTGAYVIFLTRQVVVQTTKDIAEIFAGE